jgi:hypothetical protein
MAVLANTGNFAIANYEEGTLVHLILAKLDQQKVQVILTMG